MVGGLGFGCSGNIGRDMAVFEPTHGSAPKYAGQYKVNPIATVLAAKMMLEYLGEEDKARDVEAAVAAVIAEGRVRTYDMGGKATTIEMAQAIAEKLSPRRSTLRAMVESPVDELYDLADEGGEGE
jgi:isocitrate/isopropylmalate dehydrogenase